MFNLPAFKCYTLPMSSGFFVGSKRNKEVGVVFGRMQCLHEIQHNVGNKPTPTLLVLSPVSVGEWS